MDRLRYQKSGGDVTRSAIVTGASRGIGRCIALELAREGINVTASARNEDLLQSLVIEGAEFRGAIRFLAGDLREPDFAERIMAFHLETDKEVDLLVIAAGAGTAQPLSEMTKGHAERMLQINYLGPLSLVLAAREHLSTAARLRQSARVCLLGSTTAIAAESLLAAYGASKAALSSLARSINLEWSSDGIMATVIQPGYVDTDMTEWIRGSIDPSEMIRVKDVAEIVLALSRLGPTVSVPEVLLTRIGAAGIEA